MKTSYLVLAAATACGLAGAAPAAEIYSFSGEASYQVNSTNTAGFYDVTFTSAEAPQSGGPGYTYVYNLSGIATFTPYSVSPSNPVVTGAIQGNYTLLLRQDAGASAYYVDLLQVGSPDVVWSITGDASDVGQLDLTKPGSATPTTNIIDQNFIDFTDGSDAIIEVPRTFLTFTIADAPAAVPEPASWALMVGGFGLAGAAMRRRRSVAVRFG